MAHFLGIEAAPNNGTVAAVPDVLATDLDVAVSPAPAVSALLFGAGRSDLNHAVNLAAVDLNIEQLAGRDAQSAEDRVVEALRCIHVVALSTM